MTVRVHVSEDEKFPFYSVRFREDLEEWEDDDDFEPNAELTDDEVADFRRVRAEHAAWQEKLSGIHRAWWDAQFLRGSFAPRAALAGFHLVITRDDGSQDRVTPEISGDGTWKYLVPAGVTTVGGAHVDPGDTVSGKIGIS